MSEIEYRYLSKEDKSAMLTERARTLEREHFQNTISLTVAQKLSTTIDPADVDGKKAADSQVEQLAKNLEVIASAWVETTKAIDASAKVA